MSLCERELEDAVEQLELSTPQFSKCDSPKASDVARTAKQRFVSGNPRVWWLGFQQPYETFPYRSPDDWAQRLESVIPHGTTRCWLIAESSSETYPVYDVDVATVAAVLEECSFFEYYLVDPAFAWIVADTDHNQILVARPTRTG
jgi:hypothetical protein